MPQAAGWSSFLSSGENENDLAKLLVTFLQSEDAKAYLRFPIIVNNKYETLKIESNSCLNIYTCNHEKADTRMIMQALKSKGDVVISSEDTDVLMLLCYAYVKENVTRNWYMKFDSQKFANIKNICEFFGKTIITNILKFHSLTGCDTTSYFYNVGKRKFSKR